MSRPVENCQKYTAEQVDLRNLIYADTQFGYRGETDLKLVELQSLVTRGWMQEGDENNEFDVTDVGHEVIAATLRQQADRGDGVVPDEVVEIACKAASEVSADGIESIAWPDECDADELAAGRLFMRVALEAVAPLLRAPAERGGMVEERALHQIKHSIQQARIPGNDWRRELALIENTVDEAQAALAQNAQGEAAAIGYAKPRELDELERIKSKARGMMGGAVAVFLADQRSEIYSEPIYLHAERARVPDDALNILRRCRDSEDFAPLYRQAMRDAVGQLEAFNMLAAPSQPEDAEPEEVATVECKKCGGNGGWGRLYSGPSHLPSEQCPDCEGEGTVPATIQPEDAA